jgi:diguanylate cyclase (GGDEF)-like protein
MTRVPALPASVKPGPVPRQTQRRDLSEMRSVLNAITPGAAAWDANGVLITSNPRFAELFDVAPASVSAGLRMADFLQLAVISGSMTSSDATALSTAAVRLFERRETVTFVERLSGGRLLNVHYSPLDSGGWLTTYDDVTERDRAQARLAFQAQHDALTQLANHALLLDHLSESLARAAPVAVLCIDVDRFRAASEDLGYGGSDALLRAVAARLNNGQRQNDTVARLNGGEFAILLASAATQEVVSTAVSRIIKAFSQPLVVRGLSINIGISIGVAMSPRDGRDPDALLRYAGMALVAAKAMGRGTCRFFDKEMESHTREQIALERDLRLALDQGEIEMFYQPLVQCRTAAVSGFEALMRWRHPIRGMVAPSRFIAMAESCGLITSLGEYALHKACADAATWPAHLRVAVNLSPAQLQSGNVADTVRSALAASGLEANRLELEVTESVVVEDNETTKTLLHTLRSLGVSIAMDDFGTGYSSLSYLLKFPFDKIKIDKSFVDGIGGNPGPEAILRAVIDIAKSLGIQTVAEGVETHDQYRWLAERGCNQVQGYLFSPPRPASAVQRMAAVMTQATASQA